MHHSIVTLIFYIGVVIGVMHTYTAVLLATSVFSGISEVAAWLHNYITMICIYKPLAIAMLTFTQCGNRLSRCLV